MHGQRTKANPGRRILAACIAVAALAAGGLNSYCPAAESPAVVAKQADQTQKPQQQQFLRLTHDKAGKPLALEVAIVRFTKAPPAGIAGAAIVIDLIGAVHIGEPEYYDRLNDEFETYDVVLFELVAPKDVTIPKHGDNKNRHPVAAMQNMMTEMLELEYQLDGVDYGSKNFVHADMTPKQFQQSMKDRGESFFGMFLRAMGYAMTQPAGKSNSNDAQLLTALFDKNRALALKRVMARQFQDMGGALAVFNGPNGSTLITERNRVALEVLKARLADGNKKVAIFYGAGHMPDMARRLKDEFQMERKNTRWLTAWDLRSKKD